MLLTGQLIIFKKDKKIPGHMVSGDLADLDYLYSSVRRTRCS